MESGLEVEDLESHGHLRKLCPHEGRETATRNQDLIIKTKTKTKTKTELTTKTKKKKDKVEELESHGHLPKLCPHEGREAAGWN